MSGARTEAPTPRRLRDARRRGQVVRSRELPAAVAFGAGLVTLASAGPWALTELSGLLRRALQGTFTPAAPHALLIEALVGLSRVAAPILLVPAVAAGAVALLAGGPAGSLEPLRPRLDRLDPVKGLRRLASPAALLQIALGLAKAAALGGLVGGWLAGHGRAIGQLPRLGVPGLWRALPIGTLAFRLALAALAFGALDLALARRRHLRSLRMTRDEVRRESREDEGDPQRRAERRRLHRDLLEAGPVSTATVVVVNPTHVAVALRHRRGRDEAPREIGRAHV